MESGEVALVSWSALSARVKMGRDLHLPWVRFPGEVE